MEENTATKKQLQREGGGGRRTMLLSEIDSRLVFPLDNKNYGVDELRMACKFSIT